MYPHKLGLEVIRAWFSTLDLDPVVSAVSWLWRRLCAVQELLRAAAGRLVERNGTSCFTPITSGSLSMTCILLKVERWWWGGGVSVAAFVDITRLSWRTAVRNLGCNFH